MIPFFFFSFVPLASTVYVVHFFFILGKLWLLHTHTLAPLMSIFFFNVQKVMAAAAGGPAGVHMELGGKSAMIVFDDIEDIDATVDWSVFGFMSYIPSFHSVESEERLLCVCVYVCAGAGAGARVPLL